MDIENGNMTFMIDEWSDDSDGTYGGCVYSRYQFKYGTWRVRFRSDAMSGTVATFYLYSESNIHDEIDFEFRGNYPGNIWSNVWVAGTSYAEEITGPSGWNLVQWHDYTIVWDASGVYWYIDDALIRTDTTNVPTQPMSFRAAFWTSCSPYWCGSFSPSDDDLPLRQNIDWIEMYYETGNVTCSSDDCDSSDFKQHN